MNILEERLESIQTKEWEISHSYIERALTKQNKADALTDIIYQQTKELIKLKQKLEKIQDTVSTAYFN